MQPNVVRFDGCDIAYCRQGPRGRTPLVLVHGAGGHAGWWHRVIPLLARFRDVVTVELSGHGDSDHRGAYDVHTWAHEVRTVIEDVDAGPAVIVGHSMGGLVALHAAGAHADCVDGVIAVDSAVIPNERPRRGVSTVRHFDSSTDAVANFRLRPRDTRADTALLAVVARLGIREDERGWRFKFDPAATQRIPRDTLYASMRRIVCPSAFVYGGLSELANHSTVELMSTLVGHRVPHVVLDDCYHHVPLDAPAKTAAAIVVILETVMTPARVAPRTR